jgi:hypothetical protein
MQHPPLTVELGHVTSLRTQFPLGKKMGDLTPIFRVIMRIEVNLNFFPSFSFLPSSLSLSFFLLVCGIEFRALCLLGNYSTTRAMPPSPGPCF